MNDKKDFVVIGGGIIGSAIAGELAKRKAGSVTVFEKEPTLGRHASGRNSGVIHSGINQKPGTLKAKMCLEGSRRLREFCKNRRVPMNLCGTLVVARNTDEESVIERLKKMGDECGVEGLRIVSGKELKEKEPRALGKAALFSPNGAAVDSLALVDAVASEAQSHGVFYHFGSRVSGIEGQTVFFGKEKIEARHIINCAGLQADQVAHWMGVGKEFRIIPFRGEYMEVEGVDVRSMIYQPPDLRFPFLSIHLTREADGRVLAGPSAVIAFGLEAYDKEWVWKDLLGMAASAQFLRLVTSRAFLGVAWQNAKTSLFKSEFLKQIKALVGDVNLSQLKPFRSGIRAQMVDLKGRLVDDIMVKYEDHSTHVLNAVSPGMTCSLAFAEHVVNNILSR